MNNISIKKIFCIARTEYVKWVLNGRMILMVILWIFMKKCAIDPLISRSIEIDRPLNVLEPFLAVGNSGIIVLILPIVYITLVADIPRIDGNSMFFIYRAGRKNWLLGQIGFAFFSYNTYIIFVLIGTVIPVIQNSFLYNGWSQVITDYNNLKYNASLTEIPDIVPKNLYNQMPPYKAAIMTYLLLGAYMMTLILIMILFQIWKKKVFGFLVNGAVIAVGCGLYAIGSNFKWYLPMAHSVLATHYSDYFRKLEMPVNYSILYFALLIIGLLIACIISIKTINFDTVQEVD